MEDDLPYRAEYAKSGRSSCKACKSSIEKESLRLAAMVQSPKFDGRTPNWYHFTCFFQKQRPKAIGDIAHCSALRWEDQQKIQNKIAERSAQGADEPGPSTGKKKSRKQKAGDVTMKDFKVEYAKSSRAMCRGCEIKIAKEEVRISKVDTDSDEGRRYGGLDRWHHVECFAKLRNELEFFDSGEKLPGFIGLSPEDKDVVKKALPQIDKEKVKVKDEVDGPPDAKKVKSEPIDPKLEEELKKQSKAMFKLRDNLKNLKKNELSSLLVDNFQYDPVGNERKLDLLSDVMAFGALKPCSVCKNGLFVFRSGFGYQCMGDLTEWTKCQNVEETPQRCPFLVPDDLAEEYPFLKKYKCKISNRIIPKYERSVPKSEDSVDGVKVVRDAPLKDVLFCLIGLSQSQKSELKKKIVKLGGSTTDTLTTDVDAVVSSQEKVDANDGKMSQAEAMDIPVVPISFINNCMPDEKDVIDNIMKSCISSWGKNPKAKVEAKRLKSAAQRSISKSKSQYSKSISKVKVKVKGGSAIDPDTGLSEVAHVYRKGEDLYSVVLGLTDIQNNKNSFYKMQVLEADNNAQYWFFRSWGRIGTTIGGTKLETMGSLKEAKKLFEEHYLEKSGNEFKDRHNFVKQPSKMYPIDLDYGQDTVSLSTHSDVKSKLAEPVQELVKMLFDVDIMKKVMIEYELDLEKMPLGKLSRSQIQKAYGIIAELQMKDGDIKPHVVIDASNRFYTLIPHDFGTEKAPLLDNKGIIESKLEMLESLLEMEIAYSLLKETQGEGDDNVHPVDKHYTKLNTDIEVLDHSSDEFALIDKYVKNTHGETHSSYTLEIVDVFKVKRKGEEKRYKPFKKLPNRKLLWHGSRLTNYAGILSQGLRIAPPEAPVTGYMFGKGIYFADMVSKSANYCMTSKMNPVGLLLLCEVALGDMLEKTKADYIEKLPQGKYSTKGVGCTTPDPAESFFTEDGVEIPLGKGKKVMNNKQTTLLYNEYIVYDVAQVKAQYLLKVKFNYSY